MQRPTHVVILALFLSGAFAATGDIVAETNFRNGVQGWTTAGAAVTTGLAAEQDLLVGHDSTDGVWYFQSPPGFFTGDMSIVHRGVLRFGLGHFEYESAELPVIKDYDVILISSKHPSLTLGLKGVFTDWELAKTYDVSLVETAGWINLARGDAPTSQEMLMLLSTLSTVKIRGGYYAGAESTWLREVKVLQGYITGTTTSAVTENMNLASRTCVSAERFAFQLRSGQEIGIALDKPFSKDFKFDVPMICSAATLEIIADGALTYVGDYLEVVGEQGEVLGTLFNEDLTLAPTPYTDMIAIGQNHMTQFSADGVVTLTIRISRPSGTLTLRSLKLEFNAAGCYHHRNAGCAINERMFTVAQAFPSWAVPAGDGALALTIRADLDDGFSFITVKDEAKETLGTLFGAGYPGGTKFTDTLQISREKIASYVADGSIDLTLEDNSPQNTLLSAQLSPVVLIYPLQECFSFTSHSFWFMNKKLVRPNDLTFDIPTTITPKGDATLLLNIYWQEHAKVVTPPSNQLIQYPEGYGVIQVVEGVNGEVLGYMFQKDYVGVLDWVLTDTLTIPLNKVKVYARDGTITLTLRIPPGEGVMHINSIVFMYP